MTTRLNTPQQMPLHHRKSLSATIEFRIIAFTLLHIPLAFILELSGWFGALHALAVLL
jgi:hypothetical protein